MLFLPHASDWSHYHCIIQFHFWSHQVCVVSQLIKMKKWIKKESFNTSLNSDFNSIDLIICRYCTQDMTPSGFLHSEYSISPMDITILLVFIIARICDILLIVAAIKQKSDWDKTPLLALPWLVINALELTLKVVGI